MEQTAVEILIEKYNKQWEKYGIGSSISYSELIADLEQAKKMEEEQHQETFEQSRSVKIFEKDFPPVWESWEQYYNETYKSK